MSFFDEDGGPPSPPIQSSYGVSSSPIVRDPTKPPKSIKANLTQEEKKKIQEKGIAGKGRKTKKRKPKSRRRRNGRTYRRS
jgi:hypothetical protein